MGRRKRLHRIGLLVIFLQLFSGLLFSPQQVLYPQEEERILELFLDSSPINPMVNTPWTLIIMVNHPNPSNVNVRPPDIPSSLHMDRVRIEARMFRNERWTQVEYIFISRRAGAVSLEPFLVTVPGIQAETDSISISFRDTPVSTRSYQPRFLWLGSVTSLNMGAKSELVLELTDWNPALDPPSGIFQGSIPVNAIIDESIPVAAGNGVYRYPINVIALEGDSVNLEAISFISGTYSLSIPALRIPVHPSSPVISSEEIDTASDDDLIIESRILNFPDVQGDVFFIFQGTHNRIVSDIRILWDEGRRAEALAEIRRYERDSPAGPFLTALRSEMEEALDLGFTENERWRPLNVHPLSWLICFFLFIFTCIFLVVYRPRRERKRQSVTSSLPGGFKGTLVLMLVIGLAFIFVEGGLRRLRIIPLNQAKNAVVLEQIPVHRIPDLNSAINAWFTEGQPVTAGDMMGGWRYVESVDGRAGWIPDHAVIIY